MQYQDDNQPTASTEMPVADMGCQSGEGEARFIPNGRSVPVGNFTERAIDRWKASSPFEQERLEFLKQVIAEGNEQELYDPEEQKKFGLEKDEFLVCAHSCCGAVHTLIFKMAFFISLFGVLFYYTGKIFIYLPGIVDFFIIILTTICVIYIFYIISEKIIFVTNKNIYYVSEKVDAFNYYGLKKISLNSIHIKHAMSAILPPDKSNKNFKKETLPFYLNIMQGNKILLGVLIYENTEKFNKKYNISNNVYSTIYILKSISFLSHIYNIPIYIHPMHFGFECHDKRYIYGSFSFIAKIIDIIFIELRKNIEQKFSSEIDMERYFINTENLMGLNKKNIMFYMQKKYNMSSVEDELCRVIAKRKLFGKKYDICLSRKNIWIEYNGKIIMEKYCINNVNIYNSHKYYVFVFSRKGDSVPYYCLKKYINFPFIDIIELLIEKNIEYTGSQFITWDS